MNKKEMLSEINKQLDYWCDQYKIAVENRNQRILDAWRSTGSWRKAEEAVKYDGEPERISKNIQDLEKMYDIAKKLF